jgi:hypothetical protein
MQPCEQLLAYLVVEDGTYDLERRIRVTHAVAVCQEECLAVEVEGERLAMNYDTTFLLKVTISPDVVIANEVMHLYTAVGQFGQLAKEACESLGDNMAVFVPEVEHVSKEIDSFCVLFYLVKKTYQAAFLHPAVRNGKGA